MKIRMVTLLAVTTLLGIGTSAHAQKGGKGHSQQHSGPMMKQEKHEKHMKTMEGKIQAQHEKKIKKLESWKTKKLEKCGTNQACIDHTHKSYDKRKEQIEKQHQKRESTTEHFEETP